MKHTPTPWMVGPEYYDNPEGDMKAGYVGSFSKIAKSVFRCAKPSDAAYIVKAVNAFDVMKVALEAVKRGTEPYDGYIMTMVTQAIAKAEGK